MTIDEIKELTPSEKKKVVIEMDKIFDNTYSVEDAALIEESKFNWDDLTALKDELGSKLFEFIGQVQSILTNKEIIVNLKEHTESFNQTVKIFFSDINTFSNEVKKIREQHEGLTGPIVNINDYDLYNRLAIHYHTSFIELVNLVTPTLSNLVLITSDVIERSKKEAIPVTLESEEVNKEVKNAD